MVDYDIVIVGAGPAGCSVAKYLEDKGYVVLVVDQEVFPRNKPCAGVLSPKICSVVDISDDVYERPLFGYRVFYPSGNIVESKFPKNGFIVRREKFDNYLVSLLKNKPKHSKINIVKDFSDYAKVSGDNFNCECGFVIGCDGVNSIVRKSLDIPGKKIAVAAQYEIKYSVDKVDSLVGNWFEVYYNLNYGYGWISPMKDSLKVGVGVVSDYINGSIWDVLDDFTNQDIVRQKCCNGDIVSKESAGIPMSGPLDVVVKNRVFLAGDAGGFVYPGTGEGIFYAIKSGIIAGQVIDDAISNKKFKSKYLENRYCLELEKNGLFCLRDIDFVEKNLSSSVNCERYVKRLKSIVSR